MAVFGHVKVRDDRGRWVPLFEKVWRHGEQAEAVRASRRAYDRSVYPAMTKGETVSMCVAGLAGIFIPRMLDKTLVRLFGNVGGPLVGVAIMLTVAGACGWVISRRATAGRVKVQMVRAGYCASCGYSLLDVLREEDGCRVCPECGGAWRFGGG